MKTIFSLCLFLMFCLCSCNNIEDIEQRLDNIENRIDILEKQCETLNSNIQTLKSLLDALTSQDCITNVAPLYEGTELIGYTINFKYASPITILHGTDGIDGEDGNDGENGKDGHSPCIGVEMHHDNKYYWTIDGEWLLDDNGEMIPANGTNGSDGITPFFKIEDGMWFVSYDGEQSWQMLGQATGDKGMDGDSFFQSVNTGNNDYVVFTLHDGTEIRIPKYIEKMSLVFPVSEEIFCEGGKHVDVEFTIINGGENPQVECIGENGWIGEIHMTNNHEGILTAKAPQPYADGKILVIASNGNNSIVMKTVKFTDKLLQVSDKNEYEIGYQGGELNISVKTNMIYNVIIPKAARSWIKNSSSRSVRDEIITLLIEKNSEPYSRTAEISIEAGSSKSVALTIIQNGDTFYTRGDGTPDNPYVISSAEGFIKMANVVNKGNSLKGKYIIISESLDFSDIEFTPIGNKNNPFSGIISANSVEISNISVTGSEHLGIFGCTEDAVIEDMSIQDITVQGESYMGGVVGEAVRTNIRNVRVDGLIREGNYIGGIIGKATSCFVDKCITEASLGNTNSSDIGGIVGNSSATGVINCTNKSSIAGFGSVGGIVGYVDETSYVKNCSNTSQFTQSVIYGSLGGIVGYNCGQVINCVMSNSINAASGIANTSISKITTGGICGYNHTTGYLYNCFFIKIYPLNSEIDLCGELNWGTCLNSGSFNSYGEYNGYSVLNLLRNWADRQDDYEYLSWKGTFPTLEMDLSRFLK